MKPAPWITRSTDSKLGSRPIVAIRDILDDADLPPSDVLVFDVDEGRVIVRPSGTEPKLKLYLEAVADDPEAAEVVVAELEAAARSLLPG